MEASEKGVETSTDNYILQLGCRGVWPGLAQTLAINSQPLKAHMCEHVCLHTGTQSKPVLTASISIKFYVLQIGSTEWVEENRQMLASRVVAYLNVDIAVGGAGFKASATPQLDELLIQAAKQVES